MMDENGKRKLGDEELEQVSGGNHLNPPSTPKEGSLYGDEGDNSGNDGIQLFEGNQAKAY